MVLCELLCNFYPVEDAYLAGASIERLRFYCPQLMALVVGCP